MDNFSNTVTRLVEHVVGSGKAFHHRRIVTHFLFELVVENHDQAVDLLLEVFDACLGLAHAAGTFEFKGLRDHCNGQNAEFLGNLGNYGSRAGTRAAAHAGRDKQKMRAFERFTNLVGCVHGSCSTHFGLGTGTQAGLAERNHDVGAGTIERLLVRVGRNKRDALSLFVNHVLDGIAAAATHTDHLDAGVESSGFTNFRSKIKGHSLFPCNP